MLVDGEELHRPSPPTLVHRAGLRRGQDLSILQVSLPDMEWDSNMRGEPGHKTSLAWNREGRDEAPNGGRGLNSSS